jgi:hypothetical protein
MKWIGWLTSALLLVSLGVGTVSAQESREPAVRLKALERFQGQTRVRTEKREEPVRTERREELVRVDIHNWMIGGGMKLDELPLPTKGLMIVQLRGGELTTVISGRREERREGEFWTVLPGVPMGIETGDDSATIQTIVIADR